MSSPTKRISGLQRDVLALYRSVLRKAHQKDISTSSTSTNNPSFHPSFTSSLHDPRSTTHYAKEEFRRRAATVKKSDFRTIEYMVRRGKKDVKLLQMPGVKVVSGTDTSSSS